MPVPDPQNAAGAAAAPEEEVAIDLSDAFGTAADASLDALLGSLAPAPAPAGPLVGGAAAVPPSADDPFAGLDDGTLDDAGGTAPIARSAGISWDGADPWESIGLAPPRPDDAVRLLGVLVRAMVARGLLDVREVADALVPPITTPHK
jgi:hypothetical protein